jgi:hypothetical protein
MPLTTILSDEPVFRELKSQYWITMNKNNIHFTNTNFIEIRCVRSQAYSDTCRKLKMLVEAKERVQGFGGKARRKQTTWKTKA